MDHLQLKLSAAITAGQQDHRALSGELDNYLTCFDSLTSLLQTDPMDEALSYLLDQTRDDLVEAYVAYALDRRKLAFMALRGVMEGLFSALYYRYQSMSLALWARDASSQMVHSLFETHDRNEFYLFFKTLFDDEGFAKLHRGCNVKHVFARARSIYSQLSRFIHKKYGQTSADFSASVGDVFRIFLTFLARTDDISALAFPSPLTWAEQYGSRT
jgi:hypothetical protein